MRASEVRLRTNRQDEICSETKERIKCTKFSIHYLYLLRHEDILKTLKIVYRFAVLPALCQHDFLILFTWFHCKQVYEMPLRTLPESVVYQDQGEKEKVLPGHRYKKTRILPN